MTPECFENFIARLKEKYEFTDREESVRILSAKDRAYYIDDINYISIGACNYTFWPLGKGRTELFFYVRYFQAIQVEDRVVITPPGLYISTQVEDGVAEVIDDTAYLREALGEISVNAPFSFDVQRILRGLTPPFDPLTSEDFLVHEVIRYVPTEETYRHSESEGYTLRSAKENPEASFEGIRKAHPEIVPFYHEKSAKKRFIQQNGRNEQENIKSNLDEFKDAMWTLFRGEEPMLSLIPSLYRNDMIGFMREHALYSAEVDQSMIDYALKKLCCIYRDRGYAVRTIVLFDDDPFEGTEVLKRIGMEADYRFVNFRRRKRRERV